MVGAELVSRHCQALQVDQGGHGEVLFARAYLLDNL